MSSTRHVSLWLQNEEASYKYIEELATECLQQACDNESHATTARNDAADALALHIDGLVCESMPVAEGMWGDLISSALASVDFEEIARDWLADRQIFSVFSSDDEDAELFTEKDHAIQCLLDRVPEDCEGLAAKIQNLEPGMTVSIEGTEYTLGVS